MAAQGYSVLLANQVEAELRDLATIVEGAGHDVVSLAITVAQVADAIVEHEPDVALILVESGEDDHALGLFAEIRGFAEIPLVVMAREISDDTLQRMADSSLEVLHLPGRPETIDRVIKVALKRHRQTRDLEGRLGDLDGILARRTAIEQAKGILMERHGIDDVQAFMRIRDHARAEQIRVVDIAQSIISARDLLPREAPES